ncbi:hypothetical protein [Enterobacter cloacae complex sp.]|uniref:hypothetical protein n=1 Tax=Enterobacter cloacae complex sp. TaxID=2027919 RepID=UPI0020B1109E|nr:hypothetical protein [Enterobacter cloacae complex sp.]
MSTITKEQAQKIIEAADEVITALAGTNEDVHPEDSRKMCDLWDDLNDRYAPPEVVRELARIALASLEAEPVGYMNRFTGRVFTLEEQPGADTDAQVYVPLYTAPPAPVSVPDEEQCKPHPVMAVKGELGFLDHFDRIISERDEDIDIGQLGSSNYEALMLAALDAFRAAMLQGAEQQQNSQQNIPEIIPFEQWLSQQTGTIDVECGCVMTEVFFHWLRVAYEAGNSPVIPDDVRRMDWLVSKTVDVREPMVYGSHSLFWSQAITDEEDEYHATKLREQIDAAMEAEQAAAPQQEAQ